MSTMTITVPKSLSDFLKNLPDQQASEIWEWLDENPEAINELVSVIVISHPNLHNGE